MSVEFELNLWPAWAVFALMVVVVSIAAIGEESRRKHERESDD